MPTKPLLFLALILSFTATAASAATQPVVRVKKVAENFRFELCKNNSCEPLGRENGYTRAELEDWKKFRESTTGDILPLMAIAGVISITLASVVLFPFAAAAGLAVAFAGFTYFFSKTPQVQARMPNEVYHEFQADPSLLPSLKNFLRELDQGLPVADQNPRVLSGHAPKKTDGVQENTEAKPAPSVIHAR